MSRELHNAIIEAFVECKPFPEQLQMQPELAWLLLKEAGQEDIGFTTDGSKLYNGVELLPVTGMIGWQVIGTDPNGIASYIASDEDMSAVYVEKPRHVIKSPDFNDDIPRAKEAAKQRQGRRYGRYDYRSFGYD